MAQPRGKRYLFIVLEHPEYLIRYRPGDGCPYRRSDYFYGTGDRPVFAVAEIVDHAGATIRESGFVAAVLIASWSAVTLASTVSRGGMSPKIIPDMAA